MGPFVGALGSYGDPNTTIARSPARRRAAGRTRSDDVSTTLDAMEARLGRRLTPAERALVRGRLGLAASVPAVPNDDEPSASP